MLHNFVVMFCACMSANTQGSLMGSTVKSELAIPQDSIDENCVGGSELK